MVAIVCSLVCIGANAAPPEVHEGAGLSNMKCAVWSEWRARKEDRYKTLRYIAVNWLQGYVSGVSYAFEATRKMRLHMTKSVTDSDSLSSWLDAYCQAHPEKDLDAAGQQIVSDVWEKSP